MVVVKFPCLLRNRISAHINSLFTGQSTSDCRYIVRRSAAEYLGTGRESVPIVLCRLAMNVRAYSAANGQYLLRVES